MVARSSHAPVFATRPLLLQAQWASRLCDTVNEEFNSMGERVSKRRRVEADNEPKTTSRYRRLSIKHKEIRLFSVEPGNNDEPIVCKLWHAKLHKDQPMYEIIPYV